MPGHDLIGQPHNLVRHPDLPAKAFRDIWATLQANQPWTALVKNRRKHGDHYPPASDWVPAKATPVLEGGRVQVNGSVAEIDSLTQQNAAMVEELAAAASSLNGQAAMVSESVRIFRG